MSLLRSVMLDVCSRSAAVASPGKVTGLSTRSPGRAQKEDHELVQNKFNTV